jgi:cysteine-S-conjugate beta-lyase
MAGKRGQRSKSRRPVAGPGGHSGPGHHLAGPAHGLSTQLAHTARSDDLTQGGVNPVVQRASTVLMGSARDLYAPGAWTYGIHGTATHEALAQALCTLEGAGYAMVVSSGLIASTLPLLTLCSAGGHVLVSDNVYGPTRRFCDRMLARLGVETEYVDPQIGAGISARIRPNTHAIFLESPGSLTFEISDIPAIACAARAAGVTTVMDNTWSAGVRCRPLALGVDISIQATSKYVSGGADLLGGAIMVNDDALAARLSDAIAELGLSVSPDDAFLVLRGLRTLPVRLDRHEASGLQVARWLSQRPEVARVLHPALPDDPGHALWKRDFTGATGLFGVVLRPARPDFDTDLLDALELFGLGFSWGGFESLAIPCDPQLKRTAAPPRFEGPLLRLSIGLEDPDDLIADLDQAFARAK